MVANNPFAFAWIVMHYGSMTYPVDNNEDNEILAHDPQEPIITFFLKLPEPMSVPEYTVFPERIHASALPMGWLEEGMNTEERSNRRDYTNTWVSRSSIIVHHVKVSSAASMGLDAVMKAAVVGIKGPGDHKFDWPHDMDADCTVLEVALPIWVNLILHFQRKDGSIQSVNVREIDSSYNEYIEVLYNKAIDQARNLQMAYHAVQNSPLTLLTVELLPPVVPYIIRKPEQIAAKEVVEMQLYASERSFNSIVRESDLSNEQVGRIFQAGNQIHRNPLSAYLDLDREASVALHRSGNTRVSVVMAAAASEVILDRTLLMLHWEEGKTPESVSASWRDSLKRRVELDYSKRVGGSWDTTSDGPVGRWARKVAHIRNRVVHGGYLPSRVEAEEAITTSRELVTFIGDRLADQNNLKRYTRSAALLMGNEGLAKRGRHTNAVRNLQADLSEPPWAPTFDLWHKAFARIRGDVLTPRESRLERSTLLAVYFPNNWPVYVAHDADTGRATKLNVPEELDLGKSREMVHQIFTEHSEGQDRDNPISVSIAGGVIEGIEQVGPWVEEYHLMPLRGVMVDWSNFTAPTT